MRKWMWLGVPLCLGAGSWILAGSEPLPATEMLIVPAAQTEHSALPAAEPSPDGALSATDLSANVKCLNAAEWKARLKALRRAQRETSKSLATLLQQQGLSAELLAAYLQSVGADVQVLIDNGAEALRELEQALQPRLWQRLVSADAKLYLYRGIHRHDYLELLQWLTQQPQDMAKLNAGSATFLQLILHADPHLSARQLQALLAAGLPVTLSELRVAVAAGQDLSVLTILQNASQNAFLQHWYDLKQRKQNLTLLAAQLGNAGLFDYWLAQGVPASVGAQQPNAFDFLPMPAESQALQQLLPMVRTLLRLQLAPVSANTQWFWLQHLPAPEAQQLQQLLTPTTAMQLPVADPAVESLAADLHHQAAQRAMVLTKIRQCLGEDGLAELLTPAIGGDIAIINAETEFKVLQMQQKKLEDPLVQQQSKLLESILPELKQLIGARNWFGLDQLELRLQQDPAWQQAALHADDIAVLVLQFMLLDKVPVPDTVQRIRHKFGHELPPSLMRILQFQLKFNEQAGLAVALQDAGYQVPPLPARK